MTTFDTSIDAIAGGPTSHWKLGESSGTTVTDRKGVRNLTYNTGQTLGVTGLVPANNASDTAMGTNSGTGNAFEASSSIAPNNAWTFAGWINVTAANFTGEHYMLGADAFKFALGFKNGAYEFYTNTGGSFPEVNAGTPVAGSTVLLAGTFTTTSIKIHVNGVQVGTTVSATGGLAVGAQQFAIGVANSGTNLIGTIDEVMYWGTTALTDPQHAAIYTAGTSVAGGGGGQTNRLLMGVG